MSYMPEKNADYSSVSYWNERYSEEESFEWCKSYSAFKDLIQKEIQPSDRILMLGKTYIHRRKANISHILFQIFFFPKGCGNSNLSEDMYRDGYHHITNIDYSTTVIENMKNRSNEARSMKWFVMDIKDLKFESGSFDIVIEKATLDALLVGEQDPWRLSDESRILMDKILLQASLFGSLFLCFLAFSSYAPLTETGSKEYNKAQVSYRSKTC